MAEKKRRFMDSSSGSTTFIGENTEFTGELRGPGHFVICGRIDGNCELQGPLSIARSAHWKGRIQAHDVVVAGEVEGEVIAEGKLEIAGTARIKGSLTGRSIAIAEGAVIDGGINVTSTGQVTHFLEKRKPDQEAG